MYHVFMTSSQGGRYLTALMYLIVFNWCTVKSTVFGIPYIVTEEIQHELVMATAKVVKM